MAELVFFGGKQFETSTVVVFNVLFRFKFFFLCFTMTKQRFDFSLCFFFFLVQTDLRFQTHMVLALQEAMV